MVLVLLFGADMTAKLRQERIKEHFDAKLPQYDFEMEVKGGNGGREARIAKLSLQFETVEILKPKNTAGKTKKERNRSQVYFRIAKIYPFPP
ncbi:hypothetical protein FACS1894200_09660 [Spirochaetia bacterium]|nr:hypothetical protein FACS1894200_09660 [Spirochaetia bacterium]